MTTTMRAAAGILVGLHFILLDPALAQNCYYPNGDVSTTDAACSSGDSACCPNNWECLSNGLCYDPTNKYFNRNTCTDQTWESSDCPQYCTANTTAAGNEALKQCGDGSWCCNGDRVHMDCCTMDDPEVIDVPGWTSLTKITSVPSPTSVASKTSSRPTTSSSSSSTTTTTSANSDSSSTTDSSSATTESSTSDSTSEVPTTSSASAAATSSSTDPPAAASGTSSKNLAIGLGVGIPLLAMAAALGALLLWQRKKKAKQEPPTSDRLRPGDPDMVDMYAHGKDAQEADSMPVAVNGKERPPSELIGNNHFLPTQQPSPTVSHTSSMSRFSNPPQYSPNPSLCRSGAGGAGGGLFVVNAGSSLSDVDEAPEPQELPPEGNPPRESTFRPTPIPATANTRISAYEAYGRAYGPVATTYVPSPEPPEEETPGIERVVEGENKPLGPREQKKRNDELMLD